MAVHFFRISRSLHSGQLFLPDVRFRQGTAVESENARKCSGISERVVKHVFICETSFHIIYSLLIVLYFIFRGIFGRTNEIFGHVLETIFSFTKVIFSY